MKLQDSFSQSLIKSERKIEQLTEKVKQLRLQLAVSQRAVESKQEQLTQKDRELANRVREIAGMSSALLRFEALQSENARLVEIDSKRDGEMVYLRSETDKARLGYRLNTELVYSLKEDMEKAYVRQDRDAKEIGSLRQELDRK